MSFSTALEPQSCHTYEKFIEVKKPRKITDITLESLVRIRLRSVIENYNLDDSEKLYSDVIDKVDRSVIKLVLCKTNWNQRRAATILGINRNTLHEKVKRLGLKRISE